MGHIIFILVSLALLAGFLVLTSFEARRGARVLAQKRGELDAKVSRMQFIFEHVDFAAFIQEELRRLLQRVGHDIARLTLEAVRAIERLLTRLVRHLRSLRTTEEAAPREARPFVKTLSDFKDRLKKAAEEDTNGEAE